MKRHLLLITCLILLSVIKAGAQTSVTETMTIDAAQMTAENFPEKHLSTVLKDLTLTGEWNNEKLKMLYATLKAPNNSGFKFNHVLQTVSMENTTFVTGEIDLSDLFSGCDKLTEVKFPTSKTDESANLTNLFNGCLKLQAADLSAFNNISSLKSCFSDCWELTEVTFSDISQDAPVTTTLMLAGCEKLNEVDLSRFNNILEMNNCFMACINLQTVTFSDKVQETNSDMNSAFYSCYSLQVIDLSRFKIISDLSYTFNDCRELKTITFSGNEQLAACKLYMTFYDCHSLNIVNISRFQSVINFYQPFYNCRSLTSAKLHKVVYVAPTLLEPDFYGKTFSGANPNCLKYLPTDSYVPESWTNCIVDGVATRGIKLEDGQHFNCPEAFNIPLEKEISLERSFAVGEENSPRWETICLPFAAKIYNGTKELKQITKSNPSGDYYLREYTSSNGVGSVQFSDAAALHPHKPYIISFISDLTEPLNITFRQKAETSDVRIYLTVVSPSRIGHYRFTATFRTFTDTEEFYVINQDGNVFYKTDASAIKPFTAFFVAQTPEGATAENLEIDLRLPLAESMTIDGSEVSEKTLSYGYLSEDVKHLTLTGTWDNDKIKLLKDAISGNFINENLQTVSMEDMLFVEGTLDFSNLFNSCANLSNVTTPALDVYNEVIFSSTFSQCPKLTAVDLSKYHHISDMSGAFYSSGIQLVKFSEKPQINSVNLAGAFNFCTSLKDVDISRFLYTSGLENSFSDCHSLTSVKFNKIVYSEPVSGEPVFYGHTFSNVNPNCLKYLPTDSYVPESWTNCIVDGVATRGIELVYIRSFNCPEVFTVPEGKYISLRSSLAGAMVTDKMENTICFPFEVQKITFDGNDTDFVNSSDFDFMRYVGSDEKGMVNFEKTTQITTSEPYLMQYNSFIRNKEVLFWSTNITVPVTTIPETSADGYTFRGSFMSIENQENYYTFNRITRTFQKNILSFEPFYAFFTDVEGSGKETDNLVISRKGLSIGNSHADTNNQIFAADGKIYIITDKPENVIIYNYMGQMVRSINTEAGENSINGLEKGIYIVKGQKVIL